jgi:SAM-dependent methyltransferase
MVKTYFKKLYERTMREAYSYASKEIHAALSSDGNCLDCGAGHGHWYDNLNDKIDFPTRRYFGIEWDRAKVECARRNGLDVTVGNLNERLPYEDKKFECVFALSVLEHLLYPCHFLKECHRVLSPTGKLVLLTPNISTYFTALLVLLGRMPSTGPHPDSEYLVRSEEIFKVSSENIRSDAESETPVHRHLVVFSYSVLKKYLEHLGFVNVRGYGFGLYPFPNFLQPALEKIDPFHCHQLVFAAQRGTSNNQAHGKQ